MGYGAKGQEGFLEIDFKHRQVILKDGDGDILEVKAASERSLMLEVGRHMVKGEAVEFEGVKAVLQEDMELLWRGQGKGPKGGGGEKTGKGNSKGAGKGGSKGGLRWKGCKGDGGAVEEVLRSRRTH